MKSITLFLFIIQLFALTSYAQTPIWVKGMGNSTSQQIGFSIVTDESGNIYSTGLFDGTVNFNPNGGTYNLTGAGYWDIYIQKLSPDGNFLWAKGIGGPELDNGNSIRIDSEGNVLIVGRFTGTVDFDPGPGVYNLTGTMFILKLDSDGNFIWAKSLGGVDNYISAFNFTIDDFDNIYTTGAFSGLVDFDPEEDVIHLPNVGGSDIFVQKLDSAGNFIWAKTMGSTGNHEAGYSIAVNSNGQVYVTGRFRETVDFDSGPETFNITTNGLLDIFILKLESDGTFIWVKTMGGSNVDGGASLVLDAEENILITGSFKETVDFDSGPETFNINSNGNGDAFILKMSADGNLIWVKGTGANGGETGSQILTDNLGNIYTLGKFQTTVDFNPGAGLYELSSEWNCSYFLQKLDANGNFISAIRAEILNGSSQAVGYGLAFDPFNNILITGHYTGDVDFDSGPGSYILSPVDYTGNIFIQKLEQCVSNSIENQTACEEYTWIDGISYTESNNSATFILTNTEGCDSIVSLDLNIAYASSSTDTIYACEEYTWVDGVTYTESNNSATLNLTNVDGCDSIVSLDLNIAYASSSTDTIYACEEYTWIDGISYTESNNSAILNLMNADGCDSIISLDLSITIIDTSVTITDLVLSSNSPDLSYQWLDCNNDFELIPNEVAQSFVATENGTYALAITDETCTDTSACFTVFTVSTNQKIGDNYVYVYPNPVQSKLYIELPHLMKFMMQLSDINGNLRLSHSGFSSKNEMDVSTLQSGIYFLKIYLPNGETFTQKIIVFPS